jgi:AcrR family transcriptional regulator
MSDVATLQPRRRPAQARSRERVERILEATRELVESQPTESLTMAAIARRAQVPIGSVYQYFPNRLAVLAELSRRSLREIDRQALAALETSRGRPWREVVDRVVDAHLAAFRRGPRSTPLLRALAPSREFCDIDDESNGRFADALAAHPALAPCGGPRARTRIARVAVEAAAAVESWALRAESASEAENVASEMKLLLKAYLAVHIEGNREESDDSAPPR